MDDFNEQFTSANLEPLIGENFQLSDGHGGFVEAKLSEVVKSITKGLEDLDGETFTARFISPKGAISQSGNYQVAHKAIGRCTVMFSPNSHTESEVIVSRYKGLLNHQ